ncbi:MAG: DUF3078 domain-containing protein [Chitinophagaceae bacterium]
MRKIVFLFAVLTTNVVFSQDQTVKELQAQASKTIKKDAADTSKKFWRKGGLYGFNLGQGSLSNWAAGGDEFSLSVNTLLSLYAFYQKDKNSWDNTFDVNLGYIKTTSLGNRKNDDRFDILSKYGYALNPKLNLATLFNLRSQFFKGYTYSNNIATLSSNFFAPGYVLLSLGLDYKPTKNLSIFVSPLTSRWVFVNDDFLSAKGAYGVTPGKKSNNEIGAFASVNYLKDFNKFMTYKGRLDLFSNYKRKPKNVDLFMTNALTAKIGKIFTVTYGLDMIYDDDVRLFGPTKTSPGLQVKSIFGAGFQLKF